MCHFCVESRLTVTSVLLDVDTWRGAEALPDPGTRGNEYVLGLDLGQNAAMSAAAAYFRDGRLEVSYVVEESQSWPRYSRAIALRET